MPSPNLTAKEFKKINARIKQRLKAFFLIKEKEINRGYCFLWARIFSDALKKRKIEHEILVVESFGGHVFVKVGGKYYDSDCINPRKEFFNLPCFKLDRKEIIETSTAPRRTKNVLNDFRKYGKRKIYRKYLSLYNKKELFYENI